MSIGLTRLFAKLLTEGQLHPGAKCPSHVLVAVTGDDRRGERCGPPRSCAAGD
jgi:histidyl-tRNA synthetase